MVVLDVWVFEGVNVDFFVCNGCNIINIVFIDIGDGVFVINIGLLLLYGE